MENHLKRLSYFKEKGLINPKSILDIGAYKGHWTQMIKSLFPNSKFLMIEANHDLENHLAKVGVPYKIALLGSENDKVVDYFKCKNFPHPTGNSIYLENTNYVFEPEKRKTITLDRLLNEKVQFDLIKMDVQGSELDIIKGGENIIMKSSALILEMQISEYNKGAPMMNEIVAYLKKKNFILRELIDFLYKDGELIQVDGFFTKEKS